MKPVSLNKLKTMNVTKGELPMLFGFADKTFDYALPQDWLNWFVDAYHLDYHLVLGTTFWIYPENTPFSVLDKVQRIIEKCE